MNINSIDLLGNSSIGIFGFSTNRYAIFPYNLPENIEQQISETLKVPIIHSTLNNSNLIGLFGVGNSHHLILPHLASDIEIKQIRSDLPDDVEISIVDSTITALGNVIMTTDDIAIVSPDFNKKERKLLEDILDVEIYSRKILNSNIIGSLLFCTNNGILAHPLTSDEDLDWIEDILHTPVDVVTVNRGTPYPRPGIIGNDMGVLVGSDTTGPELMRIYDVLLN